MKKKLTVKPGYFQNGLPYVKIGTGPRTLIDIVALTFKNEPAAGYDLKEFLKSTNKLTQDFTIYFATRRPNSPAGYTFGQMAEDYAQMIREEFDGPVDVMGVSTGGQLAHFLAADHPDVVRKLVIISAAYRMSESGKAIERRAEEFFKQKKYGDSIGALLALFYRSKLYLRLLTFFIRPFAKTLIGEIEYPNDFLNEIHADRQMNFKDRLNEIAAPTLLLSGSLDPAYFAEDVRATAAGIPNAKVIIYEGFGHALVTKNSAAVQKEILTFLKQ